MNICIARLNRRAGYATGCYTWSCVTRLLISHTQRVNKLLNFKKKTSCAKLNSLAASFDEAAYHTMLYLTDHLPSNLLHQAEVRQELVVPEAHEAQATHRRLILKGKMSGKS